MFLLDLVSLSIASMNARERLTLNHNLNFHEIDFGNTGPIKVQATLDE